MNNDVATSNVTPIAKSSHPISLHEMMRLMDILRENKKANSERVPDEIWDKIFLLLKTIPESRVVSALGISSVRLQAQREKRQPLEERAPAEIINREEYPPKNPAAIDFCEEKPTFPLEHKPAKAFSTNTCVVELYRRDGMLMKIHICTDKFEDLLKAFFDGDTAC